MSEHNCSGCGADLDEDDVVWATERGELSTDAGFPWCVTCLPDLKPSALSAQMRLALRAVMGASEGIGYVYGTESGMLDEDARKHVEDCKSHRFRALLYLVRALTGAGSECRGCCQNIMRIHDDLNRVFSVYRGHNGCSYWQETDYEALELFDESLNALELTTENRKAGV